jgi:colicin import membrane protein
MGGGLKSVISQKPSPEKAPPTDIGMVRYSAFLNERCSVPRPLKVFKTHIGFYDLIVASPSMKAAAVAWGSRPTVFSQGFATVTQDVDAIQAALAHPGVVLKRPHGQAGPYKVEPDAVPMPKLSARQKDAAKKAEAGRKSREAVEKRARRAAEKKVQDELAEIEREEAQLRERRQSLQKKFHIRSVK